MNLQLGKETFENLALVLLLFQFDFDRDLLFALLGRNADTGLDNSYITAV